MNAGQIGAELRLLGGGIAFAEDRHVDLGVRVARVLRVHHRHARPEGFDGDARRVGRVDLGGEQRLVRSGPAAGRSA